MALPDRELKRRIIEYAGENPIVSFVSKKSGVSRATLYRWLEGDEKFRKSFFRAKLRGRSAMSDVATARIMNLVNSSDERISLQASKYVLDHNRELDELVADYKQKVDKLRTDNKKLVDICAKFVEQAYGDMELFRYMNAEREKSSGDRIPVSYTFQQN